MATLAMLKAQGELKAVSPQGGGLCGRTFYYTAEWSQFVMGLPGTLPRNLLQRRSVPKRAQILGLAADFCADKTLNGLERMGMRPPFERMDPEHAFVWEMKTGDTRTFGWFAVPNVFVAVGGIETNALKVNGKPDNGKYAAWRDKVLAFRQTHALSDNEISVEGDLAKLVTTEREQGND
jgi:hypothetical protein